MAAGSLPTITLVTPSFMQAAFLETTIRSVLGQGYPRLEYVIMDGGSSDGSVEIIRKYRDRLHYWQSRPDGGQGAAVIEGWKHGSGALLSWLNSDDVLADGALLAIGRAYRPDRHIYYGDDVLIDGQSRCVDYLVKPRLPTWCIRYGLAMIGQPGVAFSRQLAERVGYFDTALRCSMEYDIQLRMLAAGGRVMLLPRPLGILRQYAQTKTNILADVMLAEQRRIFRLLVPGPLGDWETGVWGRRVLRALCLARYANPLNLRRIARKIWARFRQPYVANYINTSDL